MKLKVVIHEAEEGGFWTEVPAIPGCAAQGDTFEELLANIRDAVEGCLGIDMLVFPADARGWPTSPGRWRRSWGGLCRTSGGRKRKKET